MLNNYHTVLCTRLEVVESVLKFLASGELHGLIPTPHRWDAVNVGICPHRYRHLAPRLDGIEGICHEAAPSFGQVLLHRMTCCAHCFPLVVDVLADLPLVDAHNDLPHFDTAVRL